MKTLDDAIRDGKPVAGIKGFVALECDGRYGQRVYVPVTIQGIGLEGCNLKINCSANGGIGEFPISPCQLIGTKKDVERIIFQTAARKKAKDEMNSLMRWSTVQGRRRALLKYAEGVPAGKKEAFNSELRDNGITDPTKIPNELIRKLAEVLTLEANGVLDVPEGDDD
jgi:hypothetical protein